MPGPGCSGTVRPSSDGKQPRWPASVACAPRPMTMSDRAFHDDNAGVAGLPRDLTAEELDNAPVLRSVDDLLIDGLTDAETDAFFASLDE